MESASGVEEQAASFNDWIPRARDVEEKVDILEREEGEVGKLYGDILQAVYLQNCFFITLCSYTVVLFVKKVAAIWMFGFVLSVIFCYVVGVFLPVLFAYRQFSGLKLTRQKLIERREELVELCLMLREEYNQIYVFEASIGEAGIKKISDYSIGKLEGFRREDLVPKFRRRNNRKIVLVLGLCCSIYFVMVLSYAVYIAYFEVSGPTPYVPPVSSEFVTSY